MAGIAYQDIIKPSQEHIDQYLAEHRRTLQLFEWLAQGRSIEKEGRTWSVAQTTEGDYTVIYSAVVFKGAEDYKDKTKGEERWFGLLGSENDPLGALKVISDEMEEIDHLAIVADLSMTSLKRKEAKKRK